MPLTPYLWNRTTSVVRQGKYRVSHRTGQPVVEVVIETADDERIYASTNAHPELVAMVNAVKQEAGFGQGGQFYVNEFRQIIVPATDGMGDKMVGYYYAGEYTRDIILGLDGLEFSGRPIDEKGQLLTPGDSWSGRPRPGICYKLKAGGADIEFTLEVSPGRERIHRLSRYVGAAAAHRTAAKIAAIKGNRGGRFFVNEFRSLFCPVHESDLTDWKFIGILTEEDPWFPKWDPQGGEVRPPPLPGAGGPARPAPGGHRPAAGRPESTRPATAPAMTLHPEPQPRLIEIKDGDKGCSYDLLFGPYLHGARKVQLEDPYLHRPHQVANFLRFAELCVRLGSIESIEVLTDNRSDDADARIESIRRSLEKQGVTLSIRFCKLHDRFIATDTGWKITLGRGLDLYQKPESFQAVGATDFALRPCHATRITITRDTIQGTQTRRASGDPQPWVPDQI